MLNPNSFKIVNIIFWCAILNKCYMTLYVFHYSCQNTDSAIFSSTDVKSIWNEQNNYCQSMLSPYDLLPQPFSLSRVLWFLPSCFLSLFLTHFFLRVCQYSCHLITTSWPGIRQTVTRGSCIGRVHSSLLKSIELPTCAVCKKCDITYLEIRYVFKHKWVGNSNLREKHPKEIN